MDRYIILDNKNNIISIRSGKNKLEDEIQSSTGELGEIMQENGNFINDPNEEIEKLNLIKEKQKKELIEQMIVANALRNDELWLLLKKQYDEVML